MCCEMAITCSLLGPMYVSAAAEVLQGFSEQLLHNDVRAYPSRKFKLGFSMSGVEPWAPLLKALLKIGDKFLQSSGEKALDIMDDRLKGAFKAGVRRQGERYDMWRKEVVLVLRIMISHVTIRKRTYDRSYSPKRVPPWLLDLLAALGDGTADDDDGDDNRNGGRGNNCAGAHAQNTNKTHFDENRWFRLLERLTKMKRESVHPFAVGAD